MRRILLRRTAQTVCVSMKNVRVQCVPVFSLLLVHIYFHIRFVYCIPIERSDGRIWYAWCVPSFRKWNFSWKRLMAVNSTWIASASTMHRTIWIRHHFSFFRPEATMIVAKKFEKDDLLVDGACCFASQSLSNFFQSRITLCTYVVRFYLSFLAKTKKPRSKSIHVSFYTHDQRALHEKREDDRVKSPWIS